MMNLDEPQTNFEPSVWRQVKDETQEDWKLFFDYSGEAEKQTKESKKQEKEPTVKLTDFNAKRNLMLGTLVMTPNGVGKLANQNKNVTTVRMIKTNVEENYEDHLIFIQFPIYIRILDKEFSSWHKVYVSPNFGVEQLKKMLEDKKLVPKEKSFTLVLNGLEMKDEQFFDQLDLRPESKILLYGLKTSISKLNRFINNNSGWYSYQTDGISFTVNKKIKLTGVGLYGSSDGKIQTGSLVLSEGNNGYPSAYLINENVEIAVANSKDDAISKISFSKPVTIKPGTDYTLQLKCTNYCYMYYGNQGQATITGEKNIVFTFKFTNNSPHGSGVQSGNFPEYYYIA